VEAVVCSSNLGTSAEEFMTAFPDVTIVVPTFNERGNVDRLIAKLGAALEGHEWEVVFVDDNSPDGTSAWIKENAARNPRVRCLRRVGRRGLAGAVIEGVLSSAAPFAAVMDADMQHDETRLLPMLSIMQTGDVDLVVGSRYLNTVGLARGLSPARRFISKLATALGRRALRADLTDPVSGFFMIRREAVERVADQLQPMGFKILFDIVASQPQPLRVRELPYEFAAREVGQSKLDSRVALEYLGLVASKLSHGAVSPRIIFFGLVGLTGVAVHMSVLWAAHGTGFAFAQALAGLTAMTSNYLVNNAITYRDKRLRGWRLLSGYARFCALCAIGLATSVAVGTALHDHGVLWPLAGFAGAVSGAAWNYLSTYLAVW
jgi:dolichol-phosphate mannosyltransferase